MFRFIAICVIFSALASGYEIVENSHLERSKQIITDLKAKFKDISLNADFTAPNAQQLRKHSRSPHLTSTSNFLVSNVVPTMSDCNAKSGTYMQVGYDLTQMCQSNGNGGFVGYTCESASGTVSVVAKQYTTKADCESDNGGTGASPYPMTSCASGEAVFYTCENTEVKPWESSPASFNVLDYNGDKTCETLATYVKIYQDMCECTSQGACTNGGGTYMKYVDPNVKYYKSSDCSDMVYQSPTPTGDCVNVTSASGPLEFSGYTWTD